MAVTYTKSDITAQLRAMGAPTDSVVLMHSSMRAVGNVDGGAEALLDTLIEYFTRDGGLFCVPTHTWRNLDREITLDMTSDENCLGAFSGIAIRDGRGVRSENPTHSMVVFGDRARAEEFISGEQHIRFGTSADSCYGKLCDMGGKIMLVGVAQNRNTYIHAVEDMLGMPNRVSAETRPVAVKRKSGEVVKRDLFTHYTDFTDDVSLRYTKYETPFRYHGCITDGFLGNAPVQLCDARKIKETLELIFRNSDEDVLKTEWPIPQKLYCNR